MSRHRRPTRAEIELWRRVTADVQPLAPTEPPAAESGPLLGSTSLSTKGPSTPGLSSAGLEPGPPQRQRPSPPAARPSPLRLDPDRPIGIDKRSWQRLRRGQVPIEATLDLHGHNQERAHQELNQFLRSAAGRGVRCALVVTGKGAEGGGVLRQMVPRWLNEAGNRERVLAYCPAQPKHGGDGALYLLIRRAAKNGRL